MPSLEKQVYAALSQCYENPDIQITRDIRDLRLVIFSDHHRGQLDGADDFQRCKPAYHAALGYYLEAGYSLFLLGDVEELWECHPSRTMKSYKDTTGLELQFFRDKRLTRFYGNHDDHWMKSGLFSKALHDYLNIVDEVPVYEKLLMQVTSEDNKLGNIFFIHGHQGETMSDRFSKLSRWFVRNIWRNIQRITKIPSTTPSVNFDLRKKLELAQYRWISAQPGMLLITGHTHHPVFSSQSHERYLEDKIESLKADNLSASSDSRAAEIQESINLTYAELQWVLAKSSGISSVLPPDSTPCYFNTGCCSFGDGDITGLEISDSEIRLVRWPEDDGNPRRRILRRGSLVEIFQQCSP